MKTAFALGFALALVFEHSLCGAVVTPLSVQRSQNQLYSADISSGAPNEILLSVHRHDGDIKILHWSRKMPWNGANATFGSFPWIKRFISNDGSTVILHESQFRQESWVWIAKSGEPRRFYPQEFQKILGQSIVDRSLNYDYFTRQDVLEFIYDAEGIHAIWFSAMDKWLTIDLETGKLDTSGGSVAQVLFTIPANSPKTDIWLKPPSEDLLRKLEAEAKLRSFEAIRKHQPGALKSFLRPIQEKVGALVPSLKPAGPQPAQFLSQSYAPYLYLARRKDAAAEKYIRNLIEYPFRERTSMTSFRDVPQFVALSQERMLGDLAWRLWNEVEIEQSHEVMGVTWALNHTPTHYLGGVQGRLRLPFVRPDDRPGVVWIYLIPDKVRPGAWNNSDEVTVLYCHLDITARIRGLEFQFDAIDYRFLTIPPGGYRLKAVWDRRPPFSPQDEIGLPSPGDYESAETVPFTISAGTVLAGPTIDCINRVGDAANYFAADEAWKRLNPVPVRRYTAGRSAFFGPAAFSEPPRTRWEVKTNLSSKDIEFKKVEVVQPLPLGDVLQRDELMLTFAIKDMDAAARQELAAVIRDEHDCTLKATVSLLFPRTGSGEITVLAPVFPRHKEFKLELRSSVEDKLVASYSLKNGGPRQTSQWRARSLPIAAALDDATIELSSLSRSRGARFRKLFDLLPRDWTPESVIFQDREGNRSSDAGDFCREEKSLKVRILHQFLLREFIAPLSD